MTRDRAELQSWYRQAMLRRIDELSELRSGLEARDPIACDAAREIAQALRGSGGTFGFPQLSSAAAIVETSTDRDVLRRVEGLIGELRALHADDGSGPTFGTRWLASAAGVRWDEDALGSITDAATAWSRIMRLAGIDASELAARVGDHFGLEVADLRTRKRSALRLVPEALMTSARVLPMRDDSTSIIVATTDPTSLAIEQELERLTGRRPVFVVAPPEALDAVLGRYEPSVGAEPTPLHSGRPTPEPPEPRVEPVPASAARASASESAHEADRLSVLVVDDDMSARLLLKALLEKRGHETFEAGDGLEALEVMRARDSIRLIVADLNMPNMDGLELIWELRDVPEWGSVPVIVVTGEADEILETHLMEEGADDYIRKPVDPRLFLARVEATMRRAVA